MREKLRLENRPKLLRFPAVSSGSSRAADGLRLMAGAGRCCWVRSGGSGWLEAALGWLGRWLPDWFSGTVGREREREREGERGRRKQVFKKN